MKPIIFKLQKNNIIQYETCFKSAEKKLYEKQFLELTKYGYINYGSLSYDDDDFLHIYYSYLQKTPSKGDFAVIINLPFDYSNKYYIYLDHLYYKKVINELNFVIFINKGFLIEINTLRMRKFETILSIKKDDDRYKKDNYKTIRVETNIEFKYNK